MALLFSYSLKALDCWIFFFPDPSLVWVPFPIFLFGFQGLYPEVLSYPLGLFFAFWILFRFGMPRSWCFLLPPIRKHIWRIVCRLEP